MKHLRYSGEFCSMGGVHWRAEIWQENEKEFNVQNIIFASDPIEIEWTEVNKLDTIQSSKATLILFSDTDRKYMDLYTVTVGSIRLDVYRNDELYWSGTLNPELYEEPFSFKDSYEVSLTFSDFAILERKKWNNTGFITLQGVIDRALELSGIRYTLVEKYISTFLQELNREDLSLAVAFLNDNFYDEDNEAMSVREVLEEVLKPFSLRLIQKQGRVFVYDLNALPQTFEPQKIEWAGVDATLAVDKTYNDITVSFSPYEQTELLKGEVERDSIPEDAQKILIHTDNKRNAYGEMSSPDGFHILLSDTGKGVEKGEKTKFFRIDPIYSGSESAGVAWTLCTLVVGEDRQYINKATGELGAEILKVPRLVPLNNIGTNRDEYQLCIKLDVLFDVRYNPFESATNDNEKGNYEDLQNWVNYAYVPFLLTLRDDEGKAIVHYENKRVYESNGYEHGLAQWKTGEGEWGDAFLCYYNPSDLKSSSGMGGWQSNRQIIGYYRGGLPEKFNRMDQGEYVRMPSQNGWLELKIGAGVIQFDYGRKTKDIYSLTRWVLYKTPVISLKNKYGKDIQSSDIQHKAWINPEAKENLKIETIIGTMKKGSPSARGMIFREFDKSIISSFYRAGRTDRLERLLIGTVYSNYANRHNTLSGTADLLPAFGIYKDNNEPGNYLLLSEVQHLRADESEIKIVRFETDNYSGIEYKE